MTAGPKSQSRALVMAAVVWLLISCGGEPSVTPSPVEPVTPVVVVLGDSLTAGPGLRSEETYPALLQQRARAAAYPHVFLNAGVSGDTTTDAVRRLDSALVPDTRVLVVALGANDGLRGVPIPTIRLNLETIIERAQSMKIRGCCAGWKRRRPEGGNTASTFTASSQSWQDATPCRWCRSSYSGSRAIPTTTWATGSIQTPPACALWQTRSGPIWNRS